MAAEAHWNVNHLSDEPLYCRAPQGLPGQPDTEILVEGSDVEDDDTKKWYKRARRQEIGRRYLEDGVVPFIASAVLKGPFERRTGWVNPWSRDVGGLRFRDEEEDLVDVDAYKTSEEESVAEKSVREDVIPSIELEELVESDQAEPHQLTAIEEERESQLHENLESFLQATVGDEDREESGARRGKRRHNTEWLRRAPAKRPRWETPRESAEEASPLPDLYSNSQEARSPALRKSRELRRLDQMRHAQRPPATPTPPYDENETPLPGGTQENAITISDDDDDANQEDNHEEGNNETEVQDNPATQATWYTIDSDTSTSSAGSVFDQMRHPPRSQPEASSAADPKTSQKQQSSSQPSSKKSRVNKLKGSARSSKNSPSNQPSLYFSGTKLTKPGLVLPEKLDTAAKAPEEETPGGGFRYRVRKTHRKTKKAAGNETNNDEGHREEEETQDGEVAPAPAPIVASPQCSDSDKLQLPPEPEPDKVLDEKSSVAEPPAEEPSPPISGDQVSSHRSHDAGKDVGSQKNNERRRHSTGVKFIKPPRKHQDPRRRTTGAPSRRSVDVVEAAEQPRVQDQAIAEQEVTETDASMDLDHVPSPQGDNMHVTKPRPRSRRSPVAADIVEDVTRSEDAAKNSQQRSIEPVQTNADADKPSTTALDGASHKPLTPAITSPEQHQFSQADTTLVDYASQALQLQVESMGKEFYSSPARASQKPVQEEPAADPEDEEAEPVEAVVSDISDLSDLSDLSEDEVMVVQSRWDAEKSEVTTSLEHLPGGDDGTDESSGLNFESTSEESTQEIPRETPRIPQPSSQQAPILEEAVVQSPWAAERSHIVSPKDKSLLPNPTEGQKRDNDTDEDRDLYEIPSDEPTQELQPTPRKNGTREVAEAVAQSPWVEERPAILPPAEIPHSSPTRLTSIEGEELEDFLLDIPGSTLLPRAITPLGSADTDHLPFGDLMSPSPPRDPTPLDTPEELTSTQALESAALTNPWLHSSALRKPTSPSSSSKKPKKRVSFIPDLVSSPISSSPIASRAKTPESSKRFPSPPPPPDAQRLPESQDMLGRSLKATRDLTPAKEESMLFKGGSQGVGAMAEAFISADRQTSVPLDSVSNSENGEKKISDFGPELKKLPKPILKRKEGRARRESGVELSSFSPLQESFAISPDGKVRAVRDVGAANKVNGGNGATPVKSAFEGFGSLDAVIDEMGSYLEGWDVETELKKVGRRSEKGEAEKGRGKGRRSLGGIANR